MNNYSEVIDRLSSLDMQYKQMEKYIDWYKQKLIDKMSSSTKNSNEGYISQMIVNIINNL